MKQSALATIVLRLPVLIGVVVPVVRIAASNGAADLSGLSRANPVALAGMLAVTAHYPAVLENAPIDASEDVGPPETGDSRAGAYDVGELSTRTE